MFCDLKKIFLSKHYFRKICNVDGYDFGNSPSIATQNYYFLGHIKTNDFDFI